MSQVDDDDDDEDDEKRFIEFVNRNTRNLQERHKGQHEDYLQSCKIAKSHESNKSR